MYLLMNCSKPTRRSSMKDSSKMPSSPRKGSCLFSAFPGRGGTTICARQKVFLILSFSVKKGMLLCQWQRAYSHQITVIQRD
uniref:Uncharacterized protein n=1 Tax=Anguilla anguilla TaxID=7936 RepID=A0A0E9PIC8_ANGAN